MARLAISTTFLLDVASLEKRQRNRVAQLADMFQRLTAAELRAHKGINLETHTNAADRRAKTVRVDSNHRGIVFDAGDNETFILTMIGTHDQTDRWMANNTFRVNEATGALEIRDVGAIEAVVEHVHETTDKGRLYDHRKDKEFTQLGVDAELIPALRALSIEDELQALLGVLPQSQADALILLTGDESVHDLYGQIAGSTKPADVDPEDFAAALDSPASQHQFQVFTDEEDLADMLAQPLKTWRHYLHHTQRSIAYKESFSGPVRVTGGAGTGKTVVALHRAAYLARRVETEASPTILFTTFTRNLAQVIERDLRSMSGRTSLDRIDVLNVDRLAYRIVQDVDGKAPHIIDAGHEERLWDKVLTQEGTQHSVQFVRAEWEQVVLAQACESRTDYFNAARSGRGVPLDRRARAGVWKAIEAFTQELAEQGRYTYLQLASVAAGYLSARSVKPYRHIVVDEAQDLHEAQWRLLRAAAPEGPDDMFIVGDSHQRIYDRRSSLGKVGIKIVGRSFKLRINYRTTHEILRWAMALLGEETYDDLDGGEENQDIAGYHSFLHGQAPILSESPSLSDQLDALATQVKRWISDGVDPSDIGIASRTGETSAQALDRLKSAGVPATEIGRELNTADGVRVSTMHRLKGLEFRFVAVTNVDDNTVPFRQDIVDADEDPVQRNYDLMRERCLLYVACTRAREGLWVGWHGKPSRFIEPMTQTPSRLS